MRTTRVLSLSIALAAASLLAHAQTFNEVQVNLPYAITAGTVVVPAGNYEIRPMANQPDTFGFYKDGMICESIVHATPIKQSNSDVDTSLVLKVGGNHYQLSQLWIDGATGYQFNMPRAPKSHDSEGAPPLVIKARRG
jgi:hypothetical protein